MLERKRLEAEVFSLDGQLRRFGRQRERLVAAGSDTSDAYRALQERRGKVAAELKRSRATLPPPKDDPEAKPLLIRPSEPLLSAPIAPARFDPLTGIFGLGTSGVVQAAPASENLNIVAHGQYPSSGEIVTVPGGYPGDVWFAGDLDVGPEAIDPSEVNSSIDYFWLHSWKTLIPFPAPTSLSRLTYRFDASAFLSVFGGGDAFVWCFVSLGETANLSQGTDVTVNIDGGWPLMADLSRPGDQYNGFYGSFYGSTTVQRSFMVGADHVPGVAVVVGVIVGMAMMTEIRLMFLGNGYSDIAISSDNHYGHVAYAYEPQWVFEPTA
jgi:hypothetical protein